MQHIAEASLNELPHRIQYLRDFINFTQEDTAVLQSSRPLIAPLVPVVVDTVYEKLLSFSVTAKAFLPRQTGYTGVAPTKLSELTQDHPQIKFRKDFLAQYLVKLVSMDYKEISSWEYLDKVALMHTGQSGFAHRVNKPALRVEYIHCAILLGFVQDILVNAIMTHPDLDLETKTSAMRAFNKILWIQNDLFARHYMREKSSSVQFYLTKPLVVTVAASLIALGCALQYFKLSHS